MNALNQYQKIALGCTLLGVALVILYPPFYVKLLGGVIQNGHHLVWNPPNPVARVDVTSVIIRSLVILAAGSGAVVALAQKK